MGTCQNIIAVLALLLVLGCTCVVLFGASCASSWPVAVGLAWRCAEDGLWYWVQGARLPQGYDHCVATNSRHCFKLSFHFTLHPPSLSRHCLHARAVLQHAPRPCSKAPSRLSGVHIDPFGFAQCSQLCTVLHLSPSRWPCPVPYGWVGGWVSGFVGDALQLELVALVAAQAAAGRLSASVGVEAATLQALPCGSAATHVHLGLAGLWHALCECSGLQYWMGLWAWQVGMQQVVGALVGLGATSPGSATSASVVHRMSVERWPALRD